MRLVFFGQGGRFSTRPLETLARRFQIVRVVGPENDSTGDNLERFAASVGAEAVRVSTGKLFAELMRGADAGVASNFPLRIPGELLQVGRGIVNLHPSLLPEFRGHSPWLWQFYHQVEQSGWTVHLMDEGYDTGPILSQRPFPVPFGIEASQLIDQVLQPGADLLCEALQAWLTEGLEPRPQGPGGSCAPKVARCAPLVDWENWSVTRVYHFLRGSAPWHDPPAFAGRKFRAVDWSHTLIRSPVGEPQTHRADWRVACRDGHILLHRR